MTQSSVPYWCLICIALVFSFSELQDPIVCLADQPHGPPLSSSSKPVVPQATIISHVASDFSLAEPLDHALMTPSTPSLTQESNLPSPQPTIPLASSPATDLPVQSVVVSSLPQTDLSHTLSPVQSSIPSPTTPAPSVPTELVTISTPPGETGKYEKPSWSRRMLGFGLPKKLANQRYTIRLH